MQDRPTAAELLEAAAHFLETEVMPELSGRKQFHVRVTVNSLRILQREWEGEEGAVRAEWDRLTALMGGGADKPDGFGGLRDAVAGMNADLSARIRAGDYDERFDEVLAALRATVREKLGIANPKHLRA